jgi:predicted kinase
VESRPVCVVLIGLPGAGKTTFYRDRFASHDHVSKDAFPNASNKQARQDASLRQALAQGRPVVVDNTNVTPQERAAVIAIAREYGAWIAGYYLEASTREAVARNERRTGKEKVPKVAIFSRAKHLVPPVLAEGFDELHTVHVLEDGGFRTDESSGV